MARYKLYWEDVAERLLYAELDDFAWKLPEKIFKYKKESALYIYHDGKLAAFYTIKDSKKEAALGYRFYRQHKNCKKIIELKKQTLQKIDSWVGSKNKTYVRSLTDQKLKKEALNCLDLFREALSVHYLSQPQFFEKFEEKHISKKIQKNLDDISRARFEYTRIAWTKALNLSKIFLIEYAKRNKLTPEESESLRYKEIKNNTAITSNILNKRANVFALVSHFHKIKVYTGKSVNVFIRKYEQFKDIKSARGIIGNRGIKRGGAFVISNENLDLHNLPKGMKKGMILIVQNAWPEFLQYYKLASAIVTNEGGITSHGVVVAREFDIPCIVGTRIVTKIFRTGDLVEVDAHKGIVRILEK